MSVCYIACLLCASLTVLCSFRLALERKAGTEITESSRLNFFKKISRNKFALSDAENNSLGLLNT